MAILKSLIVNGVAKFLQDTYLSIIKSGTWNGSTIGVAYGGTGVTSALGNTTTPVYLTASGLALCNAYPTKSSWNYDDVYVKSNPGTVEQTIKSTISSLSKGVVNFWRNSGDHYTFIGFSNGTTEKYLGGIGFKSQSDHNIYLKYCSDGVNATTYYKMWHEGNDGASSGLDADLLDGQHGSYYATASSLSNYLPLTGGTLSGNLAFSHGNSTTDLFITWASGTHYQRIKIRDGQTDVFVFQYSTDSGSTWSDYFTIRNGSALIGSNVVYHSGNLPAYPTKSSWDYDDVYLKLSGGTISRSVSNPLNINNSNSSADSCYINFLTNSTKVSFVGNVSGETLLGKSGSGRLGIDSNGNPIYKSSSSGTTRTLYHTGNLPAYPTKASWNYDDVYVKLTTDLSISGTKTFSDNITVNGYVNNIKLKFSLINNSTSDWNTSFLDDIFGEVNSQLGKLTVLRSDVNAPNDALLGNYASGIAWRGLDTHGGMMVKYNVPHIKFFGGNGHTTSSVPVWNLSITGTSGVEYNLNTLNSISPNNESDVLFSLLPYLENNLLFEGVYPTTSIGEAPYGKSYGPFTSHIMFTSDYIPVNPGDLLYGEIYAYRASNATGTDSRLYYGINRYDRNKNPINSSDAYDRFVAYREYVPVDGTWHKYTGVTTIPTSHTAYNGSDGGGVYYIKVRIVINYDITSGSIPTYLGGAVLRRAGNIVQYLTKSSNTEFHPVILGYSNNSTPSFSTVSSYLYCSHNTYIKPSTGDFYAGGNYYANSDFRLKNIIANVNYSVDLFASLPLIKYTWKNENDDVVKLGSIAQNVELDFPELVKENKDGYKSIDYATFGAIGVIALAKEIVKLKNEINELKYGKFNTDSKLFKN